MPKPARRRRFAPEVAALEPRRLLALSALWLGQDGSDYVGTEGTLIQQAPNDYQDVHFRLTGLATGKAVARVDVERYGGGGWSWSPTGGKNAMFLPDPSVPSVGDLYFEPYFADPAGTLYQAIRVTYADATVEQTSLRSLSALDPNLRTPGTEVQATFLGQDGQDWTGATIAVGPDGFQDVHLALSHLSAGASARVRITADTTPPISWETGVNPDGRLNAELLNRPGANATLGTAADVFFSSDVNLAGVPLTIQVFYDHWNPDYRSYTNRSGKTDSTVVVASATVPTLAMPTVVEPDLAGFAARSLPQDAAFPGLSHVALDAASLAALATPQSFATIRSAVLSNQSGAAWLYLKPGAAVPYTGFGGPTRMAFSPSAGVLDFPPVRSEADATLTLLLTFDDGSQAVARFAGAYADLGRLAVDPRVGAATANVSDAAGLVAALAAGAPSIRLAAGTYALDRPLTLAAPVRITADPGATLNFVLSAAAGSPWNGATGAIHVRSSHVALDGFAIRFTGTAADWNSSSRYVAQAGLGTVDVDLSFTNLDVVAPAAATPGVWETAVALMNFDDGDTGVIANNALTGGWIQLGAAPWLVAGNDYRGAVADTITPSFLAVRRSFDLSIVGNHAHQVDPRGIAQRFIVMGNADSGQGIGNTIAGNVIDGGIGTPTSDVPAGWTNNPEIILTETYQPRFEGTPSAVSPDGFVVQVPYLRGPAARTGDVVSILTGPHAGEWRMIAQALSPTRYLLDEPLPAGSFAIAIGRGYVDQAYLDNVIDLRGMVANNVAVVISGNHWGQRIEGNSFIGGQALRIVAGSSEGAFEGRYPAPWGWSRLPVLDIVIDGNRFVNASVGLSVAHDRVANKSSAGRTYLTGSFSNNAIEWGDPSRPAVVVGSPGDPAYTVANHPWLTPGEILLEAVGNVADGATPEAATIRVYSAVINGRPADDLAWAVPVASPGVTPSAPEDDGSTVGQGVSGASWVQFQASGGIPVLVTVFTGVDAGGWTLEGSDGGTTWTALDVRPGDFLAPVGSIALAIPLAQAAIFRFLRLAPIPSLEPPAGRTDEVEPPAPAVDLALGRPASASSVEGPGYAPAAAFDGGAASRWSSGQWTLEDQSAWIAVDLGAEYDFDRVRLSWEAAFAVDYAIQTSDDGLNWTTVRSVEGATTGGVVELIGLKARGRYVRVAMTKYGAARNYSLFDMNVYAT